MNSNLDQKIELFDVEQLSEIENNLLAQPLTPNNIIKATSIIKSAYLKQAYKPPATEEQSCGLNEYLNQVNNHFPEQKLLENLLFENDAICSMEMSVRTVDAFKINLSNLFNLRFNRQLKNLSDIYTRQDISNKEISQIRDVCKKLNKQKITVKERFIRGWWSGELEKPFEYLQIGDTSLILGFLKVGVREMLYSRNGIAYYNKEF